MPVEESLPGLIERVEMGLEFLEWIACGGY
jgi:hypothetical protein